MAAIGALLRGMVLALLIGAMSILAGAVAATFFCGEGSCSAFVTLADILGQPAPGLSGSVSALFLVTVLLFVGLAISLMPQEPVTLLAILFALLLVLAGFLFWLPRPADTPVEAPVTEEPTVLQEAPLVLDPAPEPVPSCPTGTFREGGECVPCSEEIVETAPAALRLDPVATRAHWVYASAQRIEIGSRTEGVRAFVDDLAAVSDLCDAPAVLVFGSASSDGARARNEARAQNRSEALADGVRAACSSDVDIYALSLGQSEAPDDVPEDRPVSIVKVYPAASDEISGELILSELGYVMADGVVPLLDRGSRFPQPWQGLGQEATRVERAERPRITTTVPALGAPESCRVPQGAEGVDDRPALRQ